MPDSSGMVAAFNLSNICNSAVFLIFPNHSVSRSAVSKSNYILLGHYIIINLGLIRLINKTLVSSALLHRHYLAHYCNRKALH